MGIAGVATAQGYYPILPSDRYPFIPKSYDPVTIQKRVKEDLSDKKLDKLKFDFADQVSAVGINNIYYGTSYANWEEVDQYVTGCIELFHPEGSINVQVLRETEINAMATASGYVFLNVGFIAEMESQDQLEFILLHEVAHNDLDHLWKSRVEAHRASQVLQVGAIVGGLAGATLLGYELTKLLAGNLYTAHSRSQEKEADAFAIDRLKSRSPNLSAVSGVFELAERDIRRQAIHGVKQKMTLYGRTHPGNSKREEFIQDNSESVYAGGEVDEEFIHIRETARKEVLSLFMGDGKYREAIERAWKYWMDSPDSNQYPEMMYDALRRLLILRPELSSEQVLLYPDEASKEVKEAFVHNELNQSSIEYIKDVLLRSDLVKSSPIPYMCTFSQLEQIVMDSLKARNSPEVILYEYLAAPTGNGELLQSYINRKGVYSRFAQMIMDRETTDFQLDSAVVVVGQWGGNDLVSTYWPSLKEEMKDRGWKGGLQLNEMKSSMSPYEWYLQRRIHPIILLAQELPDKKVPVDLLTFDPLVAEYLLTNRIGMVIYYGAEQNKKHVKNSKHVMFEMKNTRRTSFEEDYYFKLKNDDSFRDTFFELWDQHFE